MELPKIASKTEWLAARRNLLVREKAATREHDALAAERRALPMVKVEKEYVFEGPNGPARLADLFGPHRQLLVYHFMFDPSWEEGCKTCSLLSDGIAGSVVHLGARNTTLAMVSRAPLEKIERFKSRMGWTFPWLSSASSDFNYDFQATLDEEAGAFQHNFENAGTLLKTGRIWTSKGEMPGLSVFYRDGDSVFHTYSAYQRGLDSLLVAYNLLDFTPLGRQEEGERIMSWIRHHDRYKSAV
jgi:predicted dithiol-disulfide oxidoreductase (DUF899 family)